MAPAAGTQRSLRRKTRLPPGGLTIWPTSSDFVFRHSRSGPWLRFCYWFKLRGIVIGVSPASSHTGDIWTRTRHRDSPVALASSPAFSRAWALAGGAGVTVRLQQTAVGTGPGRGGPRRSVSFCLRTAGKRTLARTSAAENGRKGDECRLQLEIPGGRLPSVTSPTRRHIRGHGVALEKT